MWIRHYSGNLLCGFCVDLLSDSRSALFKLFSPRQIHVDDKAALCGEWGPRPCPYCGADLCRSHGSGQAKQVAIRWRLISLLSQPDCGSSGSSFRASSDSHSLTAARSVNRSLIPLQV